MFILAKLKAFAVYSSCEIPLGLAYGINYRFAMFKMDFFLQVGILNSHFHVGRCA
jgi:hypothetical protein